MNWTHFITGANYFRNTHSFSAPSFCFSHSFYFHLLHLLGLFLFFLLPCLFQGLIFLFFSNEIKIIINKIANSKNCMWALQRGQTSSFPRQFGLSPFLIVLFVAAFAPPQLSGFFPIGDRKRETFCHKETKKRS